MQKTNQYIAKRLIWKANQHNLPTRHSMPFEFLTTYKQNFYLTLINNQNIGTPVLIFTHPEHEKWTIIATRGLIWGENEQFRCIPVNEIKRMRPLALAQEGRPLINAARRVRKTEMQELLITLQNEEKVIVTASPGLDFFAMYNVLHMLHRMHQN